MCLPGEADMWLLPVPLMNERGTMVNSLSDRVHSNLSISVCWGDDTAQFARCLQVPFSRDSILAFQVGPAWAHISFSSAWDQGSFIARQHVQALQGLILP